MGTRIAYFLSISLLVAAVTGCGTTAPARFYSLDSTAIADGAPATSVTVMVGPVVIPAAVDQPEFVVNTAPNRVEVDEFNRWVSPLNDAIARAVAGDLVVLLGTPNVATAQLANFNPEYQVTIDVLQFESVPGQAAMVVAVWAVRKTANGVTRSGRTISRESVHGPGFDALAAAHSRAIAKVSADIATAIRGQAEQKS
ncbi:MAG: PqiC family protein [Candidatus Binataceae bacterium]